MQPNTLLAWQLVHILTGWAASAAEEALLLHGRSSGTAASLQHAHEDACSVGQRACSIGRGAAAAAQCYGSAGVIHRDDLAVLGAAMLQQSCVRQPCL